MNKSLFYHSVKGLRRTNEDKHIVFITNNFMLLGVCDGHGGSKVSKFIAELIPKVFTASDFTHPINTNQYKKICMNIQENLKNQSYARNSGCTCTLFLKYKDKDDFYTINIGDSRIIACYKNINKKSNKITGYEIKQLTKDHKPYDQDEKKLIELKGGSVEIIEGIYRIDGLSLSRCFGDCSNNYISCVPDIKNYKTTYKKNNIEQKLMFVIIGCDGLYDNLPNDKIISYIINNFYEIDLNRKMPKNINPAAKLCELALINESTDNISVVIQFFD